MRRFTPPPPSLPARTFAYETWTGSLTAADKPAPSGTTRQYIEANLPASAFDVESLGFSSGSPTQPAQEVMRFKMGNAASDCRILVTGLIHSSEWEVTPALLDATNGFCHRLHAASIAVGPTGNQALLAELMERVCFVFIPIINAAGFKSLQTYRCPGYDNGSGVYIATNGARGLEALGTRTTISPVGQVDDLWALFDPGSVQFPPSSTHYKGPSAGYLGEVQAVQDTIDDFEFMGGMDLHTSSATTGGVCDGGFDNLNSGYVSSTYVSYASARNNELISLFPSEEYAYKVWGLTGAPTVTAYLHHQGTAPDGQRPISTIIDPKCDHDHATLPPHKTVAELILTMNLLFSVRLMDEAERRGIIPAA